ncbi:RIB43A-like with coiled-coils protein 2 [Oscarella lobularis]|uniref:RIB43A-like with coiled-coils protein 2 n=1 Tax=Oscarella lobularis TaxID=121494 RepID=UPI003313569F
MHKLDLPIDSREAAARERRRIAEEQRRSRIFDARVRQIGVDLDALSVQVKERRAIESEEKYRNEAFASDMTRNDQIVQLLDARKETDMKKLNHALNDFRKTNQGFETRREFDLNDPESKKKDKPARVNDDDPRSTVSSIQKLQGEDLSHVDRVKMQQEQAREWYRQQIAEKEFLKQEQTFADRMYDKKALEMDQKAQELAEAEVQCRQAINLATKELNLALAQETEAKRRLEKTQEEDNNFTELANHIQGDFLTENPVGAQSALGPGRVISDRWKGMSPQQVAEIRQIQLMQMEEKERLKSLEKRKEIEYEQQALRTAHSGLLLERKVEKTKKQLARELMLENQKLAEEQKQKLEVLEKAVYTNRPTDAYFAQFNTTTR